MNIEEEIKQSRFASPQIKFFINLLYTGNFLRDVQESRMKGHGIKAVHYNVLRILRGSDPRALSPKQIKSVMLDKSPDLTRIIDKLVTLGWAVRKLNPENRRQMDINITPAGIKFMSDLDGGTKHFETTVNELLSNAKAEEFSALLDHIRSGIREMVKSNQSEF